MFVADVKYPQATRQTVPNLLTGSTKFLPLPFSSPVLCLSPLFLSYSPPVFYPSPSFRFLWCTWKDAHSAYWPFKVDDFGTNQKRIYDILLVCHSNLGPSCTISETVSEIWQLIDWKLQMCLTPFSFGTSIPVVQPDFCFRWGTTPIPSPSLLFLPTRRPFHFPLLSPFPLHSHYRPGPTR